MAAMLPLLEAIWFILPAGAANIAPVIAARALPRLDLPMDFGCRIHGQPIAGSHKTWRGLIAGIAAAAATFALQRHAVVQGIPWANSLSLIDYVHTPWWAGAAMGLAALLGDAIKSVAKRRIGIAPGRAWFPFDQIDWLLGVLAFSAPMFGISAIAALTLLVVGLALHLMTHFLGYLVGLNATRI